jgi:uncharacterized protein YciI
MKSLFVFLFLFLTFRIEILSEDNPLYDSLLAEKLNADDYGMKSYVLVILKTGERTDADKVVRDSLFKGHMNNISRLANEGKLVVAGPLGKNDKQYRGIFVFNVKEIEEAKLLVETDPAVIGKLLDAEYYNWYGSAAMMEINEIHNKIQKKNF